MKFSERKGFTTKVSSIIQKDHMSDDLRNSLWNMLEIHLWRKKSGFLDTDLQEQYILDFSAGFWLFYLKLPITSRPLDNYGNYDVNLIFNEIRKYYFSSPWYEVYNFLEFLLSYFGDKKELIERVNGVLERELSAYRFVEGLMVEVTDDQEIMELEAAIKDDDFPSVKNHLLCALSLLSSKQNPDYRNSIKESISAVESLMRTITGQPKITLGRALKVSNHFGDIHPALLEAFSKLYGYTSDEDGIRHSMLDEPNLTAADAKFFLLTCTSFINYVKSKL
jgi:hypothetical protein